ncbi:hypothetical protein GCM10020216_039580 [Nonomuraea helvata]
MVHVAPAHGLCLEEVGYPAEAQLAARALGHAASANLRLIAELRSADCDGCPRFAADPSQLSPLRDAAFRGTSEVWSRSAPLTLGSVLSFGSGVWASAYVA